jgi:hypothetical protein
MDWGSGIPGVGGEPWEVGRGRWAVGSADSGADGHRLTDRGLRFIPERARESGCVCGCVWLRARACECVLLGHSLLGPHLPSPQPCPSASIRLLLAAAEESLPYAMWTLLPWLCLGSFPCVVCVLLRLPPAFHHYTARLTSTSPPK